MFEGNYFNGRDSRVVRVACSVGDDGTLTIRGGDIDLRVLLQNVSVTSRLANTHRTVWLPDHAQVQSDDNDGVDAAFPDNHRKQGIADRLERHPHAVAASVVIGVIALFALFKIALPWGAEHAAARIPPSVEKSIGDQVLTTLRAYVLKPSKIPDDDQKKFRARFAEFIHDIPNSENYGVEFYNAPGIGANAFAVPGGTIVFTDQLMDLLDDDEEFLAVAAHEIGHQQYHHVLRSVLQQSAVAIVAAYFTGDAGSASTVVIAIPAFLIGNHYSRGFEAEADDYAFRTLAAHDISPRVFADVMEKFQKEYPDDYSLAYASSHPLNAERIQRAQTAAARFEN